MTITPKHGEIKVHEFDYKGLNKVIYKENGVTIRSFPTIHSGDGPVRYPLEWNDMKVVIGSDSAPNKWYTQYAKGADLAIHEAFMTADTMMEKHGQPAQLAVCINLRFHTSAQAFCEILSNVQPRHAVAYHFFNDWDTGPAVEKRIRQTYDGPLSLAKDFMVWNVTKEKITTRMAVTEEATWAPPLAAPAIAPSPKDMENFKKERNLKEVGFSDFTKEGFWDVDDVLRPIYKEASEKMGREFPYPEKITKK